jgi:hypothetical protein
METRLLSSKFVILKPWTRIIQIWIALDYNLTYLKSLAFPFEPFETFKIVFEMIDSLEKSALKILVWFKAFLTEPGFTFIVLTQQKYIQSDQLGLNLKERQVKCMIVWKFWTFKAKKIPSLYHFCPEGSWKLITVKSRILGLGVKKCLASRIGQLTKMPTSRWH